MLRSNWFQTRYLKRNQRKINQAVQTSWYIKKEVWQHMPTLNSYLAWLRFEETTGALKYYWWTIFLDVLIYTNICTLCITIHRHIYLVYTYTYVRVGSLTLLFCLGSGRTLALQFTDKKVDVPLKYTYRKYLNLQKIFEPTRVCTLCITIHRHIFLDVLLYTNSLSPTN